MYKNYAINYILIKSYELEISKIKFYKSKKY